MLDGWELSSCLDVFDWVLFAVLVTWEGLMCLGISRCVGRKHTVIIVSQPPAAAPAAMLTYVGMLLMMEDVSNDLFT